MPIYIERIADYEAVEAGEKLKIDDMYSWMLWAAKPVARDPGLLADFQLVLSMAAIHTTTQSAMMVLYDLAARPEYIDVLREEMETAIHEDGGVLKKSTLGKMMKLDSFMKESKRVNSDVREYLLTYLPFIIQLLMLMRQFHSGARPLHQSHYQMAPSFL